MRWKWLIGAALLGACYGDPDRFNAKQAELLCTLEDKCGGDFGVGSQPGVSCVDDRIDELASCADDCVYDVDAARSCIHGIKHALRGGLLGPNCEFADGTIEDCARVYTDCHPDLDEELSCEVPEPDLGCSVGGDGGSWWALVMLVVTAAGARARRGCGRGSRPGVA